jgi:Sec-independent protein translocase protein TatA
VLLVMGPDKIPEVARTLGKGLRAARRAGQELREAIDPEEFKRPFRAWEINHEIDEAQVHEKYECPEDQQASMHDTPAELGDPITVQPTPPQPGPGVIGTVSRSDTPLPEETIEHTSSEPLDESPKGSTNGA